MTDFLNYLGISHAQQLAEDKYRFLFLWTHPQVSPEAKAIRAVDLLDETLSRVWLKAVHVALLCQRFEYGKIQRAKKFGTYRVELIIALFPRILDIWNFDIIMQELTGFECGCLYARLGWLNLFNPMKPDGGWELGRLYLYYGLQCNMVWFI